MEEFDWFYVDSAFGEVSCEDEEQAKCLASSPIGTGKYGVDIYKEGDIINTKMFSV